MRKLILHSGLAPGDLVMLTAAVRDLHLHYPGRFLTDVRTLCPEIWEHNPYITALEDEGAGVEHVECKIPLIDRADKAPFHCLHGYIDFFNSVFDLAIKPTAHRGDIHLSEQDKAWDSQVKEVTKTDIPFWIVSGGGKYDITTKWWDPRRYQEIVDAFRGRIQFVQIGGFGHFHPKLEGVIDFRGQTNFRELIRLVYHSQGVLCPPTALMHLAAAVPTKDGNPPLRAGVIIAGGREPIHWSQYPSHQFLHTVGALPCCLKGGCWKDRVFPLRDGDPRDAIEKRCINVVGNLPKCLDMITAQAVIDSISRYFDGGALSYLSHEDGAAAAVGVAATAKNWYDHQRLNISSAGLACDKANERRLPDVPTSQGRGIIMCGGGVRYFTNAWVCINMLRRFGCTLPIEVWHLGRAEMSSKMAGLLGILGAKTVDAFRVRRQNPVRRLKGWELKAFALLHSGFREVLLLDADNVPLDDPAYLFECHEYKNTGAMFWPDFTKTTENDAAKIWASCGLERPAEQEFESGQILVDRVRCWKALNLAMWFNEHSDFYYTQVYGDKETFHLAFQKASQPYHLIKHPIVALEKTMCQHDPKGRRLFQHRNFAKWDLVHNHKIDGFLFEAECLQYVEDLRRRWDGVADCRISLKKNGHPGIAAPRISAVIIAEGDVEVERTRAALARTDWNGSPVFAATGRDAFKNALSAALQRAADFLLVLRGSLTINCDLRARLLRWEPLQYRKGCIFGLANPRTPESACDYKQNAKFVNGLSSPGDEAILLSMPIARFLASQRDGSRDAINLQTTRLLRKFKMPIVYHSPALVKRKTNAA